MRNLKRALSLTLASVMLLGMMVVGTSALSFNDADGISNVTAATVLEELGVMVGDGQGNFMPDQPVTRAQMAIIICRIMYGNRLNVDQLASEAKFTDVAPGEYYTGYVNFAAAQGIIGGYGDGRFGPDDTVTTAQAALMLARGLGYYQNGEDQGDWGTVALNAISLGTKLKMFGNLKLGTNDLLARDNVAEMTFNTMTKAVPVMYNATWNLYYTDSQDVLNGTKFDYLDSWAFQNYDLVYDTDSDEYGRPSTRWGIGTVSGATNAKGDLDDNSGVTLKTPFIEVENAATWTYTTKVTGKKLATDIGRSTADGYTWNITKPDWTDDDKALSVNGVESGNGVLTQIYLTTTGSTTNADVVIIRSYLAQVSSYNSSKKELTLKNVSDAATNVPVSDTKKLTLSSDDFDNLATFAKDDYVLVTVNDNGDIQTIKKAEVVNGDVTAYVNKKTVTAGGKTYSYAKGYDEQHPAYKLGSEFELYMDDYGYVIYAKGVEADDDYLYVTKASMIGGVNGGLEIKFFKTDGTEATGIVHTDSAATGVTWTANAENVTNNWYKYETKGGKYVLSDITGNPYVAQGTVKATATTAPAATNTVTIVENNKSTVNVTKTDSSDATSTVKANNDTLFIIKKGDDVNIYNGVNNVPDVKVKGVNGTAGANDITAKVSVVNDKDGVYAKYVVIESAAKTNLGTSGSVAGERIFIVDATRVTKTGTSDKPLYVYEAVRNGVEETITTDGNNSLKVGLHTDVSYSGEYVDSMNLVADASDETLQMYVVVKKDIKYKSGYLSVGPTNMLSDDCKVFITDGDKLTTTDADGFDAKYESDSTFTGTIYVVIDKEKIIEVYAVEGSAETKDIDSVLSVLDPEGNGSVDSTDLPANESFVTDKDTIDKFNDVWGGVSAGRHVLITYDGRALNKQVTLTIKKAGETDPVYTETTATTPSFGSDQGSFLVNLDGLNHTYNLSGGVTKTGAWACTGSSNNCDGSEATNPSGVAAAGTYNWTIVQNNKTLASGSFTVTAP